MTTTARQSDHPDPDDLDRDELLDAFDRLLFEEYSTGIGWHRRSGISASALRGEVDIAVWTPPSVLVELQRSLEHRAGEEFDVPKFADEHFEMQLVAVLNALDADIERALEGGIREEVEELYLGLLRLEREGLEG